jgi:hypothetical protein
MAGLLDMRRESPADLPLTDRAADTGIMASLALLAVVVAIPTAAGYAAIGIWRGSRRFAETRHRPPPAEPIERLEARLRRLRAQLEAAEIASGLPAKNLRVQALRGAYADVLAEACSRLEIRPPAAGEHVRQADIYRIEAALRQSGLDVRETAAH